MKKIVGIIILAISLYGCKTTEENYRNAYEIAKQKKEKANEALPEGTTLRKYEQPQPMAFGSDTLSVLRTYVSPIEESNLTRQDMKRFNIVVGQFKQKFNAVQMMKRLIENGYPEAGVMLTRQQDYYVVSCSVATPAEAAQGLTKIESDTLLTLRPPLPFVLIPSNIPF